MIFSHFIQYIYIASEPYDYSTISLPKPNYYWPMNKIHNNNVEGNAALFVGEDMLVSNGIYFKTVTIYMYNVPADILMFIVYHRYYNIIINKIISMM